MSQLSRAAFDFFAHDAEGKAITKEATCACGRIYTRSLLSERFMKIVEARGQRAINLFMAQIPDLFVPVHCPRCERRDIARQARIDEARLQGSDRPNFGHTDS